jgi:hypothetical protein
MAIGGRASRRLNACVGSGADGRSRGRSAARGGGASLRSRPRGGRAQRTSGRAVRRGRDRPSRDLARGARPRRGAGGGGPRRRLDPARHAPGHGRRHRHPRAPRHPAGGGRHGGPRRLRPRAARRADDAGDRPRDPHPCAGCLRLQPHQPDERPDRRAFPRASRHPRLGRVPRGDEAPPAGRLDRQPAGAGGVPRLPRRRGGRDRDQPLHLRDRHPPRGAGHDGGTGRTSPRPIASAAGTRPFRTATTSTRATSPPARG